MGLFAGVIGDIPGSSAGMFATAASLDAAVKSLQPVAQDFRDAPSRAPSWVGLARDEFDGEHYEAGRSVVVIEDGLDKGRDAVDTYAWVLDWAEQRVSDLQAKMNALDLLVSQVPRHLRLGAYLAGVRECRALIDDYLRVLKTLDTEARTCAAVLCEAMHFEAVNLQDVDGDGELDNVGQRRALSQEELAVLWEQIQAGAFDYHSVHQGSIGDCYFLASLMGVMSSEDGRSWLRECIRPHHDKNGDIDGFLVTVYDDPLHPDRSVCREVFVDSVYAHGLGRSGASVAGLFELVYGQNHPGGTLESKYFGISFGTPDEAMKDLMDVDATTLRRSNGWFFGWGEGYSDGQRLQIEEALAEGHPAAAATVNVPKEHFDAKGKAWVEVEADGATQKIRLYHAHSYMIESADEAGVMLCNPHGYNDLQNGGYTSTGSFHMSWDDFEDYFGTVSVGGDYQ